MADTRQSITTNLPKLKLRLFVGKRKNLTPTKKRKPGTGRKRIHFVKVGDRYEKLTVLEVDAQITKDYSSDSRYHTNNYLSLCLCDCGTELYVSSKELVSGRTKSCGCSRRKFILISDSLMSAAISTYKKGARERHKEWTLTIDEAKSLLKANCFYCGRPLSNWITKDGISKAKSRPENILAYSGIDRIINSIGYTIENCVSCCRFCNSAKRMDSVAEFLDNVKRVYEYLNLKDSFDILILGKKHG